MKIPFRRPRREVIRSLNAITEEAWLSAKDLYDYVDENQAPGDSLEDAIASLDIAAVEEQLWKFYFELACCALDRENIVDLSLLSSLTLPIPSSEALFEAFEIQGQSAAVYVSSLRQDNQIPETLAILVELAARGTTYLGGIGIPGRAMTGRASGAIGTFLHKQFFRTTQELYELNLRAPHTFIQSLALPYSLAADVSSPRVVEHETRNAAIAHLTELARA